MLECFLKQCLKSDCLIQKQFFCLWIKLTFIIYEHFILHPNYKVKSLILTMNIFIMLHEIAYLSKFNLVTTKEETTLTVIKVLQSPTN